MCDQPGRVGQQPSALLRVEFEWLFRRAIELIEFEIVRLQEEALAVVAMVDLADGSGLGLPGAHPLLVLDSGQVDPGAEAEGHGADAEQHAGEDGEERGCPEGERDNTIGRQNNWRQNNWTTKQLASIVPPLGELDGLGWFG